MGYIECAIIMTIKQENQMGNLVSLQESVCQSPFCCLHCTFTAPSHVVDNTLFALTAVLDIYLLPC